MTIFGCPTVGTCETLTYVQADHLGSTSTLTDVSGQVVARERYSAFGERRRSDNLALTDRLYTGQRLNLLSNLYHYTDGKSAGRFYDPLLARFIQPDSIMPGKGSQALNPYAYSVNNPVRYTDPTGHAFKDDNPGGEWGSPIAVNAVYDDYTFGLFMQAYRDYNVEYDPVLNNIEETPWAYMDVKGTRSAIQITQGRWALEHGVAGWQTLMLAGTAGLALGVVGAGGNSESVGPVSAREFSIAPYGQQPSPRGTLQAHHIIQDDWARANLAWYDNTASQQAWSILLERGNTRHSIITTAQNARRDARVMAGLGKWSSSLREEFMNAVRDMRDAGISQDVIQHAIRQAYKFFDR